MNRIGSQIIRFLVLLLVQAFILNEINLGVYVNPYIYVMFIILLPFEIADWLLLVSAFVMGICLDSFGNTMGLHASACVFAAFMRPTILRFMKPREGYESGKEPTLFSMGAAWFLYYSLIMTALHHTWFFILEIFRFSDALHMIIKIVCSVLVSMVLILLAHLLTGSKRSA